MFELISYSIIYSRHLYYDHIFKINSEINIRKFRRLERWRDYKDPIIHVHVAWDTTFR